MNKLFISLLFIASLFVTACSNDEHESIPPFSLTENYYEVRLGQISLSQKRRSPLSYPHYILYTIIG